MKRRVLITALATVSLLSLTAGSAALAAGLPNTYAGQTLRVLMGSGGAMDDYRKAAEEFTKETGINFEFTQLGYGEQYQKLILDVTSGTNAFDAYAFAYQWKSEVAPYFADLEAVSSIEGAPSLSLDDYPGDVIEVYGRVDGKLMGLPILGDATLFVWNKALYEAAGLDPASPPGTWEEVFANGVELKAAGHSGLSMPGGKNIQTAVMWLILFADAGGEYFGDNYTPLFDSPEALQATKLMVEKLQAVSSAGNLTWDFPEMLNGLTSGDAGQGFMWPGGFGTLLDPQKSAAAGDVAWGPTPGASLLGGWSIGVNDSSPSREAAMLFAAWLSSKEVQREASAPARTSVLSDPALVEKNIQWPAVLAAMSGKVAQYPPINESEQIIMMIYDEVNAALAGAKTSEQAMADLQAKATEFVKKAGYQQ